MHLYPHLISEKYTVTPNSPIRTGDAQNQGDVINIYWAPTKFQVYV